MLHNTQCTKITIKSTVFADHQSPPSLLRSFGYTLRLRFALESSFGPPGVDICLSSSLFAGGKFSCSMLSNLNLLQSLITPLGPVDMTNSILYSGFAGCGIMEYYSQNLLSRHKLSTIFTMSGRITTLLLCKMAMCRYEK